MRAGSRVGVTRTAWTGRPNTGSALARPCPRCPAGPHTRCFAWESEGRGRGRWKRVEKSHHERISPGSQRAKTITEAVTAPCAITGTHPFHWHQPGDVQTWCRGAL